MRKGKVLFLLNVVTWIFFVLLSMGSAASGDTLSVTEYPVTATGSWETMPRLGNDGVSDLVVFTRSDLLPDGTMSKAEIWYQRLTAAGAPLGSVVQVTSDSYDNQLDDVSGDYIVYTAYDTVTSVSGRIMVYQISTGSLQSIASAPVIQEPRISGTKVVWREGAGGATMVMLYDLSWLGSSRSAIILAGPIPPTYDVDIGDRFVVWIEMAGGQFDLVAYDLVAGVRSALTATVSTNEREPSTSGTWIVWEARDKGAASRIVARNMDSGEERGVADSGVYNYRPSIDGDLIAYESKLNGNLDVFVYRISTGETFQVKSEPADQYRNDVFSDKVAYVDRRTGNEDIYVSKLTFVPPPPPNNPPVADAGADQTVHTGNVATLDGSGSSDPEGDYPLTYSWEITSKPSGSSAALSDPTAMNPSFNADLPGDYVISLIVTDSAGLSSPADEARISTYNSAPVADAGVDKSVILLGSIVLLDGSGSYDLEGDPMTYQWTFIEKPEGSAAVLSNPASPMPFFVADIHGTYRLSLVVGDPWVEGSPDEVLVSFENVKPVANAGVNQSVTIGSTANLDGSGSSDANGDALSYNWSIVTKPEGSITAIVNPASAQASLAPDLPGAYVASLVVNDGFVDSDPGHVTITAIAGQDVITQKLRAAMEVINSLAPAALKNANMINALTNKINETLIMLDEGRYVEALDKLKNDILAKTDGCAAAGKPDRNDWINNCASQGQVYPMLMDAINQLQSLINGG